MKNLKNLATELKEFIYNEYEPTKVEVTYNKRTDSIIVQPIYGNALHCIVDVVDFCRGHKLSAFVKIVDNKCTFIIN